MMKTAHLPMKKARKPEFLFYRKKILKCDYNGFQYSMKSYGITLEVPRRSVAIGKEIHMEIGVTLCGPFSFPRGTRFISPIVSLRLLGENALTEPFQLHVTLRHILGELTELKARHHRVQFCCNDYDSSDPGTYKFHLNDDGFISQSFTGSYGRVIMKKFCILCMTAADTPEVQSEIGYRLTRVMCTSELKNEAYLCLSYDAYVYHMMLMKRSDAYLEFELSTLAKYFGKSIFNCMVVAATMPEEVFEDGNTVKFSGRALSQTKHHLAIVLSCVFPGERDLPDPPLVFISMADTCETVLAKLMNAPVACDHVMLEFDTQVCARCGSKAQVVKSERVAVYIDETEADTIPYDESKCHPLFIPKYTKVDRILGGIAHLVTLGRFLGRWPTFRSLREECVRCRAPMVAHE